MFYSIFAIMDLYIEGFDFRNNEAKINIDVTF